MVPGRGVRALLAVALALTLSACAGGSAYAPAADGRETARGYRDQAIGGGRYLISFTGTRDEDYVREAALLRAAEVAVEAGADQFFILRSDLRAERYRIPGGYEASRTDTLARAGWSRDWIYGASATRGRERIRYVSELEIEILRPGMTGPGAEPQSAAGIIAALGPVYRGQPETAP